MECLFPDNSGERSSLGHKAIPGLERAATAQSHALESLVQKNPSVPGNEGGKMVLPLSEDHQPTWAQQVRLSFRICDMGRTALQGQGLWGPRGTCTGRTAPPALSGPDVGNAWFPHGAVWV